MRQVADEVPETRPRLARHPGCPICPRCPAALFLLGHNIEDFLLKKHHTVVIGEKIFDIIAHTGHQPGGMVVRSGEFRDGHAAGRPC